MERLTKHLHPLPRPEARLRDAYALWEVHPTVVQELLGHANVTLDTYPHVLPKMQGQAAEQMDETAAQQRCVPQAGAGAIGTLERIDDDSKIQSNVSCGFVHC